MPRVMIIRVVAVSSTVSSHYYCFNCYEEKKSSFLPAFATLPTRQTFCEACEPSEAEKKHFYSRPSLANE